MAARRGSCDAAEENREDTADQALKYELGDRKQSSEQTRDLMNMSTFEQIEMPSQGERLEAESSVGRASDTFRKEGAAGLLKLAKDKLEEWKKTKVKIAVVGQSGSGKSSFINTIRDIEDPDDRLYAGTGVTECTTKASDYAFPKNDLIKLWDLPGAGTEKVKADEYAKEMKFHKYDAFILLSSERFTQIDNMIAQEIKGMGKPFFFARTKMDNAMRDEKKKDEKRKTKTKFDPSATADKIRKDCQEHLKRPDGTFPKIYLIANLSAEELNKEFGDIKFDNNELTHDTIESLPELQKAALGEFF